MDAVKEWAVGEFRKLMPLGIFEDEELTQMIDNLTSQDNASINSELCSLLDSSLKETKKFIKEFLERVRTAR